MFWPACYFIHKTTNGKEMCVFRFVVVVWSSSSIPRLAALDLETGVEQTFGFIIVQNRQAVQSVGWSRSWTLEDNMVDGFFFYATLTGCWGGHTSFVKAGAETSDTGAEAVEPDPHCSWEGQSERVGTGVGDENAESREVVQPLCIPLVIHPMRPIYLVVVRWTGELLCGGHI